MLAVILTVLKIIGITLLVILGVLIVLLLLVLFVPIRYRLDANVPETDLDEGFDLSKCSVKASFTWLLHFIKGTFSYPEEEQFQVRVLGIKIFPRKQKKNKDTSEETETKQDLIIEDMEEFPAKEPENTETYTTTEPDSESDKKSDEPLMGEEEKDDEDNDGKSFLDVVWKIIETIEKIIETPQNVFSKIQYTISRVCGKISMIKITLENDIFKRAFALVKRKLIKVLKMVLPDKCDIDLMLGIGDPATEAELMGAYGALYPVLYNKLRFRPDFERRVVECDAHIKGHITAFTLIYSAAVCYFNKDVKKTIKRFQKIINS